MGNIETALRIALEAHTGQLDRAGEPYILHPLRVMCAVRSTEERIVALLHDVVEDSSLTLEDLRHRGFSEDILAAVDCLTKRKGEPYEELIERAVRNPLARRVKLADLEDNMNLRRNLELGETDLGRLRNYLKAWRRLTQSTQPTSPAEPPAQSDGAASSTCTAR